MARPKRAGSLIQVRLDPELLERLTRVAHERVVGRNLIVERAVERFLDELEEDGIVRD